ncbi:MAG: hypothetical protein KKD63_05135 [Proteobacteria bacterium]|nr:hypothetical protein [Desulfobulbaceae bacterium]MBU4152245.1 hypothetical protein [Pseudomonadota bacterium]
MKIKAAMGISQVNTEYGYGLGLRIDMNSLIAFFFYRELRVVAVMILVLIGVRPDCVLAGSISITTSAVVHYSEAEIRVELTVSNVGADKAVDVSPEVRFQDTVFSAPLTQELLPGNSHRFDLAIPHVPLSPGEYPLFVVVRFHDTNGFPFSSISVANFVTDQLKRQSELVVEVPSGTFVVTDQGQPMRVGIKNLGTSDVRCRVRVMLPIELDTPTPDQSVLCAAGQSGVVTFLLSNRNAMANATYPVAVVAEYDRDGSHYTSSVYQQVSVAATAPSAFAWVFNSKQALLAGFTALLVLTLIVTIRALRRGLPGDAANTLSGRSAALARVMDAAGLLVIYGTIWVLFDPRLLFVDTVLVGGDSSSWQAVAQHLFDVLLPAGRLTGWDMGNFCGYPNFTFYFIPPFLLAALPAYLFGIPLTITLKCATMSGVYLLPVSTYVGVRMMKYRFPAPLLAAAASLVFVLNEGNTMFGGNMLSTLSGEFSYMFTFALLPLFLGMMWRGGQDGRGWIGGGLLLGFIGLSHLFVFIPAVFVVIAVFCLTRQGLFAIKTSIVGFGVMAFWLLPLLAYRDGLTTPVYMIWQDFANWRYSACGLGLIFSVATPLVALSSLKREGGLARWWRVGTLCLLLLTALTYVYVLGKFGLYGEKFWGTGFSAPTPTEALVPWQVARWIEVALLPLGLFGGGVLVWTGFRAGKTGSGWQRFVGWLTACFVGFWLAGCAYFVLGLIVKEGGGGLFFSTRLIGKGRWLGVVAVLFVLGWLPFWRSARVRLLNSARMEGDNRLGIFLFLIGGCLATYGAAHYLQIPDIRFLPPILFVLHLLVFVHLPDLWFRRATLGEKGFGAATLLCLAILAASVMGQMASSWYRDNNRGYEALAGYGDFMRVNNFLRDSYHGQFDTPLAAPRVAYEKADGYGIYGGDRAFESLPYFSGRQTMEGIHYSSSPASKFMAFFQSEFSRDLKEPVPYILSRIRPDILPVHCDLYNVSQFVVRTDIAKQAFDKSLFFRREFTAGSLAVYRYLDSQDAFVAVPAVRPVMIPGRDWLQQFYQWYRSPENNDVLLVAGDLVTDPEDRAALQEATAWTSADLSVYRGQTMAPAGVKANLDHMTIRFETERVGEPHLVKVSYFPNWRVKGANGVYPVSPHLMLVIPRQHQVTLTYERNSWDWLGNGITWGTLMLIPLFVIGRRRRRPSASVTGSKIEKALLYLRVPVLGIFCAVAVTAGVNGVIARNPAVRVFISGVEHFNEAVRLREHSNIEASNQEFRRALAIFAPLIEKRRTIDHQDVINALLFAGMSYESVDELEEAERMYRLIIDEFPFSRYLAEGEVRIAQLRRRTFQQRFDALIAGINGGQQTDVVHELSTVFLPLGECLGHLRRALTADPQSTWGGYGQEELERIKSDLVAKEGALQAALASFDVEARDKAMAVFRENLLD